MATYSCAPIVNYIYFITDRNYTKVPNACGSWLILVCVVIRDITQHLLEVKQFYMLHTTVVVRCLVN